MRVTYGQAVYGEEEKEAILKVLNDTTQMGENTREFEKKIAKLYTKKYGVAVNSGSSGLLIGIQSLHLPKGSEVITPVLTFATTISSLLYNELIPVYVDVVSGEYVINVEAIENKITENTSAILVPHLLGNVVDLKKLRIIADKYNLILIEDSCDTLAPILNEVPTGYYSDLSITSFYGSHIITGAGNGGMICLNNSKQYEELLLLRSWGRSSSLLTNSENIQDRFKAKLQGNFSYDQKFLFLIPGYQLESSEISAAFGLVQLSKFKTNLKIRNKNYNLHQKFFSQYEEYFILPKQTNHTETAWLAYPLTIKETAPFDRESVMSFFENYKIQTRVIMTGNITRQPGFVDTPMVKDPKGYPVADEVTKGGMLIGLHHGLNEEHIEYVHNTFKKFLNTL